MFNVLSNVNWLGYLAATIATIALAGVWFGVIVAKPYPSSLGRDASSPPTVSAGPDSRTTGLITNLGPVLCAAIVTLTSAVLVESLDIITTRDALTFGLIVGIGYLSAMTFQIAINPNFPRPLYYGALNAPYFVASAVVSSLILVALR